jgi:hypothetical protein
MSAAGKPGAPRNNQNRKGKKSVKRDRIPLTLSISEQNGLLALFERYLEAQGIEPTDDHIRSTARDMAYEAWETHLKRFLEDQEADLL